MDIVISTMLLFVLGTVCAAVGYASGHRDGKREGYRNGRDISRHGLSNFLHEIYNGDKVSQ